MLYPWTRQPTSSKSQSQYLLLLALPMLTNFVILKGASILSAMPAVVIFTSGTTGPPKDIVMRGSCVFDYALSTADHYPLTEEDVVPTSFSYIILHGSTLTSYHFSYLAVALSVVAEVLATPGHGSAGSARRRMQPRPQGDLRCFRPFRLFVCGLDNIIKAT
jgi:hypothetical protein